MDQLKNIEVLSAQCKVCGFTGSLREVELHDCDIHEHGGRCEDFPCCGHKLGECQNRPEYTSEYWYDRIRQLEDNGYDPYEIDMMLSRED